MRPIKFKHQNVTFAKDQPEYQDLPALRMDTTEGEVISCWQLSFIERLQVLITGKVWLSLMTFNKPLTPSYLTINRKEVFHHTDDEITFWKKLKLKRVKKN